MKTIALLIPLAVAMALPAKAESFRPEVTGAILGGIAGAAIGHNNDRHTAEGAIIGAAVGFGIGALISNSRDEAPCYNNRDNRWETHYGRIEDAPTVCDAPAVCDSQVVYERPVVYRTPVVVRRPVVVRTPVCVEVPPPCPRPVVVVRPAAPRVVVVNPWYATPHRPTYYIPPHQRDDHRDHRDVRHDSRRDDHRDRRDGRHDPDRREDDRDSHRNGRH